MGGYSTSSNNVSVTADTEFPAAAALADNTTNPTTTLVGACLEAFDGVTWDRVTNGTGTAATSLRVNLATDVALPAGTNGIGKLTANSGVDIGDVDVTSIVPGTAANNLGKAEDTAHTTGDTGVFILGVRNDDAGTSRADANGDYAPISVDSAGIVFVKTNIAEDSAHTSGEKGFFILGVRNDANAAMTSTDADYTAIVTDSAGRQNVYQQLSTGATTSVASSATNVTLLAANTARKAASIYNDSTQVLYIKYGATASTTSYKTQIAAGAYFEFPQPCYAGIVDGIWAAANGNARISEET